MKVPTLQPAALAMSFVLSSFAPSLAATEAPPIADRVQAARALLDNELLDYPATRFRKVRLVSSSDAAIFCGELNTRNAAGGFTGWTPFYVYTDRNDAREKLMGGVVRADQPTPLAALISKLGTSRSSPRPTSAIVEENCSGPELDGLDHSEQLMPKAQ